MFQRSMYLFFFHTSLFTSVLEIRRNIKKRSTKTEKVKFKFPFLLICHEIPFFFAICYLSTFSGLFFKCDKNAKKITKKDK